MAYDFIGSIAQLYISFAASLVTGVVPGDNFYKVMLFAGATESAGYFVETPPAVGTCTELTSATYAGMLKGALLTYLSQFYAANALSSVFIVIYDDSTVTTGTFPAGAVTALTTQYNLFKDRAFFKLLSLHDNILGNSALATLCASDSLLSQCWIDANDAQMLVTDSTTSMYAVCHTAGSDPVMVYHPDATKSGSLTQLGITLGVLNATGTPVGNSLDYLATLNITASGASGANMGAVDINTMTSHNVGFFLTVGDGTGSVALKGGKTIKGNVAAAKWIISYIDFVSAVLTANMLTTQNRFKNNETYQCILGILGNQLYLFSTIGRLSNVKITAPVYAKLPAAVGDMITVPNAWSADYNDNVRKVQVQGTLYITAS